jgi:hypothetical protein
MQVDVDPGAVPLRKREHDVQMPVPLQNSLHVSGLGIRDPGYAAC